MFAGVFWDEPVCAEANQRAYRQRRKGGGGQIGCKPRLGEALSARTDLTRHGQALVVGFVCTIDCLVVLGLPAEALDRASRSKRVELPVSRMLPCGSLFLTLTHPRREIYKSYGRLWSMVNQDGARRSSLRGKVVITCAVTGSIHTPTMSPYLPLTPDEIARDAIAAAEAGAAILHLHARDPKDGRPTPDPDVFMQFLPRIKQATQRGRQHHDRRRPRHDPRRAPRRAAARQARDVLAQHGVDEFRPLSDARPLQGLEIRLGARSIWR